MARYTNESIVFAALRGENAETANGNMSTANRAGLRWIGGTGAMPKVWARLISERAEAGAVGQVIRSYSTPIAWLDAEYGWIIPVVTYSVTTSVKHQTQLHRLRGTKLYMPWDATEEDARRVLAGELRFVTDSKGNAVATVPGPNYVPEV